MTKTTDPEGNSTENAYDAVSASGCSSCQAASNGLPSKTIYPTFSKEYRYDQRGRKTAEIDMFDSQTLANRSVYDPAGRVKEKIGPDKQIWGQVNNAQLIH